MKGKKMDGILQIVRLRQLVKKWHMIAGSQNSPSGTVLCSLSPKSNHRSPVSDDSDQDCCTNQTWPPSDVPEGYLAVYVGRERRRFIIPTSYLSRPVFRTLLDRAEEEFGFDHQGGLTIPCEVSVFTQVLRVLGRNDPAGQNLNLDELLDFYPMERECGSQTLTSPTPLSFSNTAAVQ
jgi:SAUR family protein